MPGKTIRFSDVGELVIGISQRDLAKGGSSCPLVRFPLRYNNMRVARITLAFQPCD